VPTSTTLDTVWTIEVVGAADDNLQMEISINRTNNAVPGLTDFQIVDYIRDQLAAHTGRPASIFKIDTIKTTE